MNKNKFADLLQTPTLKSLRESLRGPQVPKSTLWYNYEHSEPGNLEWHISEWGDERPYWEAWEKVRSATTEEIENFINYVEHKEGKRVPTRDEIRRMWFDFKKGGAE